MARPDTFACLVLALAACGTSSPIPAADAGVATERDGGEPDAPVLGRPELCNGADDDVDGRVDEGCPIRLTSDPGHDVYPTLHGGRVAWLRVPSLFMGELGDVYVRELPEGEERLVFAGAWAPVVSGDRVAYGLEDAYGVTDLVTGESIVVTPTEPGFLQSPHLDGDLLVWSQRLSDTEEDHDVFVHDLSTGETARVTDHPAIQEFPRVDDGTIVWSDDRRGHHTVGLLHLYDLYVRGPGDDAPRPLTDRAGDRQIGHVRDLDAGRVLTNELHGPLLEAFTPKPCVPVLYEIATGARAELAEATIECFSAWSLSGDWVALEHDPQGLSDLYLARISSGGAERLQVTDNRRRSQRARLEGPLLVWQDDRNDHWDIYMMDLTDLEAGDFHPEGRP